MKRSSHCGILRDIGPIIVSKLDGRLHHAGSARRTEYYIQNLEWTGDPNGNPEHNTWRHKSEKGVTALEEAERMEARADAICAKSE